MKSLQLPEENFREFLYHNRYFFLAFTLLWMAAFITLFFVQTGAEIFWLNARRTYAGDLFFRNFTQMGEPLGYIIIIIVFCLVRYRTAVMVPLLGVAVTLVSWLSKAIFAHARPMLFFTDNGLFEQLKPLDGVILYGGNNSFPSGHTMSAFALFSFAAFSMYRSKQYAGLLLLLVAVAVGISRIYLIQHFLRDVVLGALLGLVIGILFYWLQFRLFPHPHTWLDNGLLRRRPLVATERVMDEEAAEELMD